MTRWPLLWALVATLWTASSTALEDRKVQHRLIGGHYKIQQSDDTLDLMPSESGGKNGKKTTKTDDSSGSDDKKTLSQQVADGKYGLIQKELFAKPSKRPGILSYDHNAEVPKDTAANLGGLTKSDIWLAENHLLVLKGGTYPPPDGTKDDSLAVSPAWPPLDDYKAPERQVKIPLHPKVPPPFPVQLRDDGPLQILGTNFTRTLNGTYADDIYALSYQEGFGAAAIADPNPANATAGQNPHIVPGQPSGEWVPGSPFPHFHTLNGTLPPSFASLPPGAAILPPPPPPEFYDEDDPSIYYPPPYSFYYPKDNSSAVPAGPLVPGIVLPPPPNFFAPLEETTVRTTTTTTTKKPRTRPSTTSLVPQIHPTTTPVPPTSVHRKPTRLLPPIHVPSTINNELKPITTTTPRTVTVLPAVRPNKSRPSVTILKPVKPIYVYDDSNSKPYVSTTQVPLKIYYSTANNEIETPEKYVKTTPRSTQYYYYEEQQQQRTTTPKPKYYRYEQQRPLAPPPQQQQEQYVYVTARPYTQKPRYRFVQQPPKPNSFNLHISRLQNQINRYYTTPRPLRHSPKPVYQFSFEAANYRRPQPVPQPIPDDQDKFRPLPKYSVQIQPAIEIVPTEPPPQALYQSSTERFPIPKVVPRPVTQYSFDATPNPVYQGYYSPKPDDGYFDDKTKNYFNTFGQKLQGGSTPVPPRQRPPTLADDLRVNYVRPRPPINPDAEFVNVRGNYQQPQQPQQPSRDHQPGSFISYQLPGDDGAHFYFLTPQLALRRDQGAGYYYSQPRVRRDKDR